MFCRIRKYSRATHVHRTEATEALPRLATPVLSFLTLPCSTKQLLRTYPSNPYSWIMFDTSPRESLLLKTVLSSEGYVLIAACQQIERESRLSADLLLLLPTQADSYRRSSRPPTLASTDRWSLRDFALILCNPRFVAPYNPRNSTSF
ncbi:hypothetical protein J6590_049607 [Homalodisca vitripennis]|nr:hypothetical protein J6590_049607 [Homalodisca vitripennis]